MSERLTDEQVASYADMADRESRFNDFSGTHMQALAREVQEWRTLRLNWLKTFPIHDDIDALCARHGVTVEGIVALVDEVFGPLIDEDQGGAWTNNPDRFMFSAGYLRRIARQEDA